MYFFNCIIIGLFLGGFKLTFSSPLIENNEIADDTLSCGIPQKIPPSYSRHEYKDVYEFNWMVTINEKLKNDSDIRTYTIYDGILIHPRVVLTNARLLESLKKKPITVKISQVQLSMTGFGFEEIDEESNDVKEIIFHPQYNKCSLKHDLALLILTKPFDLNKNANILCLPEHDPAMEENLHCKEIPFSLQYSPLKEHNCSLLTIKSVDEETTNDFQHSDSYDLKFFSNLMNTNETDEFDLSVETSHFFCKVNGQPPYFYGGMKTRLRSRTPTTYVLYFINDKITNYLKWIKYTLRDRFEQFIKNN